MLFLGAFSDMATRGELGIVPILIAKILPNLWEKRRTLGKGGKIRKKRQTLGWFFTLSVLTGRVGLAMLMGALSNLPHKPNLAEYTCTHSKEVYQYACLMMALMSLPAIDCSPCR